LSSNIQCGAGTSCQFLFYDADIPEPIDEYCWHSTTLLAQKVTVAPLIVSSNYPIYLYIRVLPILGLDTTINDLAHPKFEDSKPFIIGELEFRQLVISYEAIE